MPHLFPSEPVCPSPKEVWVTAFQDLGQRITGSFVRQAPHQQALAYLRGLMSPVERKKGWQVAEELGEATPYAMQHLLDRAKWATSHRSRLGLIPLDVLCSHPDGILVYHEQSNEGVSENPFDSALSNPQILALPQRRPGPDNPLWKIDPSEWPTVVRRVVQNKEPLRQVARDYGVSYEAVRRVKAGVLVSQFTIGQPS